MLAAAACVVLAAVATQVPLLPAAGGSELVPFDTWLGERFPGARDLYRERLVPILTPGRLALLLLSSALLAAAAAAGPRRTREWLAGWVPPLSAPALGWFRVVFALAMLAAWRTIGVPDAVPMDLQRGTAWLARVPLVRDLAATPGAAYWLWQGASVALAAFAAGAWSRIALASAALLMTLVVGVLLTTKAAHDWGIPLVTMWVLVVVPWRDSGGVQAAWERRRGRAPVPVTPVQRGLAIWLPGLTIGMAFAAAAFAKLDVSGLEWITGGAVRYHFIEDARQAPVVWGTRLAGSDLAAVALSFGAIAVEGLFWLVLFVRSAALRMLFGVAGIAMLCGFYLLQGVFWPGWWALFVAFAPWPLIGRAQAHTPAPVPGAHPLALGALQAAVILALAVQQPVASAFRFESEPFVSDYSMYSYTWPSKAAFDEHLAAKTARRELRAAGVPPGELEARLRQVPRALDVVVEAVDLAIAGRPWDEGTRATVSAARASYERQFGEALERVEVRVTEQPFDWGRGEFAEPRDTAMAVVDLESGRLYRPEPGARVEGP